MAQFLFRGLRLCKPFSFNVSCFKCQSKEHFRVLQFSSIKFYSLQTGNKTADTTLDSVKQPEQIDLFGSNNDERQKEKEKAIKNLKLGFFFIGASVFMLLSGGLFVLISEDDSDKSNDGDDSIYPVRLCKKGYSAVRNFFESMRAPSYDTLLPDPLPYPYYQPKYTLLLELNDLLIHPEWTYSTGWRFKKRPNVDHFLERVSQHYEIVVFTASNGFNVYPIVENLDKNQLIMYKLVKNATDYIDGHHVKNLERINRDLSKVIMVDCDERSVKIQRDNALVLPKWEGDDSDQQLVQLAEFLNVVATSEVEDVREVLAYYKQFKNPLDIFAENQRKLLELQEEQRQMTENLPFNKTRDSLKGKFLYGK